MGAPKQKWTAEEEAALKAGVIKHGAGKWRTILKDPEFSGVLYLRSNVDLKDKWRNMSVMANGWGSRDKTRLSIKRTSSIVKQEDNAMATALVPSDEEIADTKPIPVSTTTMQIPTSTKRSIVRLDNLIMEAITSLKEPGGSNKTTIAAYIEEQYWAPPDFKRLLSAKLKYLTACGRLIKVKRRYRIAPTLSFPERRRNHSMLFVEGRQRISPRFDRDDFNVLTKSQVDLELAKMRTMSPKEASAAAARAVAEAEAAIAEAEEAAREAEVAEADAEAAQAFADAAMKTLKGRNNQKVQAGPSYLAVATRMHFQRTAGLEQEIENLKKKLASCTRENQNLQEELSEAFRIKTQLADLHRLEVAKNVEAEKQVKFFQGCVAAAFAERDHSIMEAEKAKEKEELMAKKFNEFQSRLEELTSNCLEQSRHNNALQIDLAKQEEENENLRKVVSKFYEIRQQATGELEDANWDDQCTCLLLDPAEMWSFNDSSTSKYISSLEEELERVRSSVDDLRNKLRMGLEIENHLKKKVRELERKKVTSIKMILNRVIELRHYHSQHRTEIMNLLDMERSNVKEIVDAAEENFRQFDAKGQNMQTDLNIDAIECKDVHMSTDAEAEPVSEVLDLNVLNVDERKADTSDALAQALQEKVAALLLLSQQEERHLLEKNVNAALQKKIEELQRNLLQVTNEKVKALLELAQLKRKFQLLQEKSSNEMKQGSVLSEVSDRRISTYEKDGKLKNLLKKTYLSRWVGAVDARGNAFEAQPNSMDFARMRIENATLKESMESMDHLTSTIHRLRLSLLKVTESITPEGRNINASEALDEIISEARLVKTALGSSLPVSWSAEGDGESIAGSRDTEPGDMIEDSSSEKLDSVSAAGFEMVDLLILAAQILKERTKAGSLSGS
ncbi:hypothetical protein CCACVL1_01435 [Corchorus capsularis]|uniref:MYB transcription factor n=1 Tax=Corchorus capsularis TaxID=210143 RepID=A0A1R3KIB0_COCAP|nr:hypothetical protein CCACVL1_01435 [Corchorus capsularis]